MRHVESDGATTFAVASTTASSAEEARMLARVLVEQRLAACVQILPMESVYRWHDGIEEAQEWLVLCKIRAEDFAPLEAAILARHSYETPEIIMSPVARGSAHYLAWIAESTTR